MRDLSSLISITIK